MTVPAEPDSWGYDSLYEEFDSPLQQRIRCEAYGEDIGQHSWVTAEELQEDIPLLRLSRASSQHPENGQRWPVKPTIREL